MARSLNLDPAELRKIADTPVLVSALGVGTASFGDVFGATNVAELFELAGDAVRAGVSYFDTSPSYGFGLAERRLGAALEFLDHPKVTLSTKAGRTLNETETAAHFDFSRDAILREFDRSLSRLTVDRVDILYLHDPDDHERAVYESAWPTLLELKAEGRVGAIGFGMNQWQLPTKFVDTLDVDVVLLAGRYTLLDVSAAATFLPLCQGRNVSVVLGGVFNSGVLVNPKDDAWYDYRPASYDLLERARAMRDTAAHHQVTLSHLALRFCAAHPAVTSTIVGVSSVRTFNANLSAFGHDISSYLWRDLEIRGLLR